MTKSEMQEYYQKVANFFGGDTKKAYTWFNTENPMLGGFSPLDMIRIGRKKKLFKFIDAQFEGHHP